MINKLNEKIDSIKEVLSNMPKNNKKNKLKYVEYISGLMKEYLDLSDELSKEIKFRYEEIISKIKRSDIDFSNIDTRKKEYEDKLLVLNQYSTPYEKIGLDKLIYEIMHFYKDDFDALNEDINSAIKCFEKIGVELKEDSFCYSPYVKEYMSLILNKEGIEKLKNCFDSIYWKCPNIIFQIALNFKYLYYKYEKNFVKYYQLKKREIKVDIKELTNDYNRLIIKKCQEEANDLNKILTKFLDKSLNIGDYDPEKVVKYENSLSDEKLDIDVISKFYNSLYEYKGYLEYSYIIDEFIKLYNEKDKYKNVYKNSLKEIKKQESNIIKINKKISMQDKYFKNTKKKNILLLNLNEQVELVHTKYNELEFNKFYEIISTLDDNTSYYDILNLSISYYIYLREVITKENDGISDEEINLKISSLRNFLLNSNLNILKNIKIKDNVDIALLISDRYKLLNLNVTKEDIESNIASLMDTLEKLKISNVINNSNVTYEELQYLYNTKDILVKS